MRRWPRAKPAIVAKTTATGTTPSTMSTLDDHERAHVRLVEGLEEVAPLRVIRPRDAQRDRARWMVAS